MLPAAIARLIPPHSLVNRVALKALLVGSAVRKQAYRAIDRSIDRQKLMINLGGGNYFRRHWKVLDFPSSNYRFLSTVLDYPFDLTSGRPFPLESDSVAFYFCSHTFEHIPEEHCLRILSEMYRTLRPSGAARFTMPDFDLGYAAYGNADLAFFEKYPGDTLEDRFLDFFATYMKGRVSPETVRADFQARSKVEFADHYTKAIPRESQKTLTGHHINWWNYDKLSSMLKAVGYKQVYRSTPQGSMFAELRGRGRNTGFDSTHPEISLFVEAVK